MKITAKRDADLHLRLPKDLKDWLDQQAEAESRRTTDYILLVLLDHMKRLDAKTKK